MTTELLFHATTLSNFAQGFDKYARTFDKSKLPRITYPTQFFLLTAEDIAVGVAKAIRLLEKLSIPGDRVVVLGTEVSTSALHPNTRTGVGRYVAGTVVEVTDLFELTGATLSPLGIEDALAAAMLLQHEQLKPYERLTPRTMSVLPIARSCQAQCKFCYSEASVSADQSPSIAFQERVEALSHIALLRGAGRFVITGGGEPGLLKHQALVDLIKIGARTFDKVVLITNGIHIAKLGEPVEVQRRLQEYGHAGLTTLALSRHHHNAQLNADIMGVDTRTELVLSALRGLPEAPKARLICVLQKGGIASASDIEAYLAWAVQQQVSEVCFKELYVSTAAESVYAGKAENDYSRENQVPLAVLLKTLSALRFEQTSALPWGAPVFEGVIEGQRLKVAAYTEPSVFWERSKGIARSWNLLAGGACMVSLEDPLSDIAEAVLPRTGPARTHIPLKVIA